MVCLDGLSASSEASAAVSEPQRGSGTEMRLTSRWSGGREASFISLLEWSARPRSASALGGSLSSAVDIKHMEALLDELYYNGPQSYKLEQLS